MAFPGPHAHVYYNEEGEPLGWDYPSDPDPYDLELDRYDRDRYADLEDEDEDEDEAAPLEAKAEDLDLDAAIERAERYGWPIPGATE